MQRGRRSEPSMPNLATGGTVLCLRTSRSMEVTTDEVIVCVGSLFSVNRPMSTAPTVVGTEVPYEVWRLGLVAESHSMIRTKSLTRTDGPKIFEGCRT